eukprot:5969449-Amphidinium_carterae.1
MNVANACAKQKLVRPVNVVSQGNRHAKGQGVRLRSGRPGQNQPCGSARGFIVFWDIQQQHEVDKCEDSCSFIVFFTYTIDMKLINGSMGLYLVLSCSHAVRETGSA